MIANMVQSRDAAIWLVRKCGWLKNLGNAARAKSLWRQVGRTRSTRSSRRPRHPKSKALWLQQRIFPSSVSGATRGAVIYGAPKKSAIIQAEYALGYRTMAAALRIAGVTES